MKTTMLMLTSVTMLILIQNGCGHPSDTDVTFSPGYGFAPFAGTVLKTKVKLAVADLRLGSYLLAPDAFDPAHPSYRRLPDMKTFTVVPAGTRLRIGRLMRDNGDWGGVRVTATLEDGRQPPKTVYLDDSLLAPNAFLNPGQSLPKSWGPVPDFLEEEEKMFSGSASAFALLFRSTYPQ